ncbi:MAG: ATP-grasp domain-containing protein [Thermosipho sp. (in: Bacteria)]|nr:ATP-grasp domain-containing protein [Thermosipho sp. (in: thermotogales)]
MIVEAEYRKVLPVVRYLGKKGYNVYTISLNRFSIGGSSKYVKENYFLKELSINEVLEIISKHNVDIVIPSNEKSVEFFAKNIEKFNIPIVVPDVKSYEICLDKSKTLQFADRLGVRVPKTFVFKNFDEFKKNIDKINIFPVVLKPKKSSGSRGIIYVNSRNELLEVLNEEYVKKYEFPLIQEYIPLGGRAIGASFLYYKGEEVLGFCHQRIREYPPDGGPSTLAVSVYNEEALSIGRKLLDNLNWNGLAMVEFKENPRNSELVLMEINPRCGEQLGLQFFLVQISLMLS